MPVSPPRRSCWVLWPGLLLVGIACSDSEAPHADSAPTTGQDSRAAAPDTAPSLQDAGRPGHDTVPANATATVSGRVTCSCSSTTPVPGVTVTIGGVSATADDDGRYALAGVQPGTRDVTATGSTRHHDYKGEVEIKADANTVNITMQLR